MNVFLKSKLGNLMVMLSFVACFMGCRDDEFLAKVELPSDVDFAELDCWSYEIPFSISTDKEWEVAVEGALCYVSPIKGKGNAIVKICVIDNESSERRDGTVFIRFPKNNSKDCSIELSQKSKADYGDNSAEINKGNRIYAVGYGYDTFGEYASLKAVKAPIIRWSDAVDDGIIALTDADSEFAVKSYTGACITDITNDFCISANLGGSYGEFRGEILASFESKDFSKNNLEYALAYVEVAKSEVYIEGDIDDLRRNYMLPEAYRAINGFDEDGNPSDVYPSTNAGFKRLVEQYGTHFVKQSVIGGRLKYAMTVDLSKVNGLYSLNGFLNANYNNSKIQASVGISDEMKMSYNKNTQAIERRVSVLGGTEKTAKALKSEDSNENLENWMNTLNKTENTSFIGFSKNTECLIPLYELIDISHAGGKERYEALKAYLEGTVVQNDFKVGDLDYKTGHKVMFAPYFSVNEKDPHNSLIWNVVGTYQDGVVARLCHEYIPVINKKERVFVLYPIIGGKTKFNMGVFMGDDAHRPAKICWEGSNVTVFEDNSLPIGRRVLYIKGSEITGTDSGNSVGGRVSEYRWTAPGYNDSYDYGLVKIFDKIWLRENYRGNHDESGNLLKDPDNYSPTWAEYNGYGQCFYTKWHCMYKYGTVGKGGNVAPVGWRVSSFDDYEVTIQKIIDNQIEISSAKAFFPDSKGGVLGFHHVNVGHVLGDYYDSSILIFDGQPYGAISSTYSNDGYAIVLNEDLETIAKKDLRLWGKSTLKLPIRLVKDISRL